MENYLQAVRLLPRPTTAQKLEFTKAVCQAHSWYKHAPLLQPGLQLQFFIDPAAGMQLEIGADSRTTAVERMQRGFHYSWLPTADYRARFGYLAFSRSGGTMVALRMGPGAPLQVGSHDAPRAFDSRRQEFLVLPQEILDAGRAGITAIVHHHIWQKLTFYMQGLERGTHRRPPDPDSARNMDAILARASELLDDIRSSRIDFLVPYHDERLQAALEPERAKVRAGLFAVMTRVEELIWGPPSPLRRVSDAVRERLLPTKKWPRAYYDRLPKPGHRSVKS